MNKTKLFQIFAVATVLLTLCLSASAQDVKYNFMPGTDFTKYKTYKWVRVPNAQYPNQIMDTQIMTSIDAQLSQKGLTKNEDNPDLYVAYQASVDKETQWNSYSSGGDTWGWGRWGGGWGGMQTTTTTSQVIRVGTLSLDVYDVAAKNQVSPKATTRALGPTICGRQRAATRRTTSTAARPAMATTSGVLAAKVRRCGGIAHPAFSGSASGTRTLKMPRK